MARKPSFSIDMCIRTNRTARRKGDCLKGHLGVFYHSTNDAYVFLKPIREWVEKYAGRPAPESLLIKAITETACHEVLHSLIISRGPKAGQREHRAISRLMAAADMDWRYQSRGIRAHEADHSPWLSRSLGATSSASERP